MMLLPANPLLAPLVLLVWAIDAYVVLIVFRLALGVFADNPVRYGICASTSMGQRSRISRFVITASEGFFAQPELAADCDTAASNLIACLNDLRETAMGKRTADLRESASPDIMLLSAWD